MAYRLAKDGQRLAQGWTQRELADRAGTSLSTIQQVENGRRNLTMLMTLADVLELPLANILVEHEAPATTRKPRIRTSPVR